MTYVVEESSEESEEECKEYKPVCGTNYVTYANKCDCHDHSMQIAYYGMCKEKESSSSSEEDCKKYKPVCGTNFVTYANRCQCYAHSM